MRPTARLWELADARIVTGVATLPSTRRTFPPSTRATHLPAAGAVRMKRSREESARTSGQQEKTPLAMLDDGEDPVFASAGGQRRLLRRATTEELNGSVVLDDGDASLPARSLKRWAPLS